MIWIFWILNKINDMNLWILNKINDMNLWILNKINDMNLWILNKITNIIKKKTLKWFTHAVRKVMSAIYTRTILPTKVPENNHWIKGVS